MTNEQRNEIAFTIARRAVWTSRPPENEQDLRKWLEDRAKEYDLTFEEFAGFADLMLKEAFVDIRVHLHNITKPEKKEIGFSPVQT